MLRLGMLYVQSTQIFIYAYCGLVQTLQKIDPQWKKDPRTIVYIAKIFSSIYRELYYK